MSFRITNRNMTGLGNTQVEVVAGISRPDEYDYQHIRDRGPVPSVSIIASPYSRGQVSIQDVEVLRQLITDLKIALEYMESDGQ